MRLGSTPLRELEYAQAQQRDCALERAGQRCAICRRLVVRAFIRVTLSAAAYTVVALLAILVVWAVIVAVIGGFTPPAPAPTNVQLPTI